MKIPEDPLKKSAAVQHGGDMLVAAAELTPNTNKGGQVSMPTI
jgi:hypothetical protein